MVVPSLNPGQNLPPFANAGPDRVVSVVGQAQSATVALNGSGSFDVDGTIVSYQWLENGAQIATGQTASVSLPTRRAHDHAAGDRRRSGEQRRSGDRRGRYRSTSP